MLSQIPRELTYQGHLIDKEGNPVNNVVRMTFNFYEDSLTNQYVFQEALDVNVDNGYYSVSIGTLKPFNIDFEKRYFLTVTIDGIESKKIPITTVPYAIRAMGVTNQSVYVDDMNAAGSQDGEALLSDGKSVDWKPVVTSIIGDGSIRANMVGSTVYLIIPEGAMDGSKVEINTLDYQRFLVPKSPKDKQYLSYDGVKKTLVWVDEPILTLTLPYKQDGAVTDTLFMIRNTRNGPAGRFVIETNPGTQHALIGENNGTGAAIAGFAKGNGSAGLFSLNNSTGTASALRVESNARKHGIEISMTNTTTTKTSGLFVNHTSVADSVSAVLGNITAANPGVFASAIRGNVQSGGKNAIGVVGMHAGSGHAIMGLSNAGIGVMGQSFDSIGVLAKHVSETGTYPALQAESSTTSDSASAIYAVMTATQLGNATSAIFGEIPLSTNRGSGVVGKHQGSGIGVEGISQQGIGMRGISSLSHGVYGQHSAITGSQSGVYGATSSLDSNASGVVGSIDANAPGLLSSGVKGVNNSKNANGFGVFGVHTGQGAGIYGTSQSGSAVYGYTGTNSQQGIGVRSLVEGRNASAFQARTTATIGRQYGIDAIVTGDSAIAIRGKAPVNAKRTSYAGYFEGHIAVSGGDIMRVYSSATSSEEKRVAPVAYGSIESNGAVSSGTGNISCFWDINTRQYFITIHAETYSTSGYITSANAINTTEPIIVNTSRAGADMLAIACYTLSGQKVQSPFHFIVYKP